MKGTSILVAVALVTVLSGAATAGRTWYVAPGGNGNGSEEWPLGSIQDAIDRAFGWPGLDRDTIIVADGIYGDGSRPTSVRFRAHHPVELRSARGPSNCILYNTLLLLPEYSTEVLIDGFTVTGTGSVPVFALEGDVSAIVIRGNVITRNYGSSMIKCYGEASPVIVENVISCNSGPALTWEDGHPIVINNLIVDNIAPSIYGGQYGATGTVISNTIVGNIGYNPAIGFDEGLVSNCIVWRNRSYSGQQIDGPMSVRYSNIERGHEGEGNISVDPLFADAERGDYHLLPSSPCIDAGDPLSDCSLEPEPGACRINMGAYGNTPQATQNTKPSALSDANRDCKVNILDLIFIRNRIGKSPATGDNLRADVNGDDKINILDLILARNQMTSAY